MWAYRISRLATKQLNVGSPLGTTPVVSGPALYSTSPLDQLFSAARSIISQPEASHYTAHIPFSPLQKAAVALLASVGAFADPRRADLVAAVGETTGLPALRAIRKRMLLSATGREVLTLKPRITNESVAHAWDAPAGSFGEAYAKFMGDRGFQADERPPVRFIDDPDLAYVAARAREVHDFWHVLFDCHTNVFGEVALKALEFTQTGLPMTGMAVLAGEWKLKGEQRALLNTHYLPWAVRAGSKCSYLMSLHYEKHFEENLDELRKKWNIERAPVAEVNALKPKEAPALPQ